MKGKRAYSNKRICYGCGINIPTENRAGIFCSKECKKEHRRKLKATLRIPYTCVVCRKVNYYKVRTGTKRKYCSKECKKLAIRTMRLRRIDLLKMSQKLTDAPGQAGE